MASTTSTEENVEIVSRFVDVVINGRDLDRLDEFVAEDVVDHTPMGETRGRDAVRETTAAVQAAFPDFAVEPQTIVSEADTVAILMRQRGTHEGPFMGYEPSGRSFDIEAMGLARLEDGRIAERWVRPDVFGMLVQLGHLTPPEG